MNIIRPSSHMRKSKVKEKFPKVLTTISETQAQIQVGTQPHSFQCLEILPSQKYSPLSSGLWWSQLLHHQH